MDNGSISPQLSQSQSISVIIPVYNGESYLHEAITSVLAQTHEPLEIIVIDDGSIDRSMEVASSFGAPVRCLSQKHAGAAKARNLGVSLSQGDFLCFLDADDLWLPAKIELQLPLLQQAKHPAAVFCYIEQFLSPELPSSYGQISSPILPGASVCTLLIRRKDFDAVGPFSTQWSCGEFIDWYSRAKHYGIDFQMLPQVLVRRRLHQGNLNKQDNQSAAYAYIVKAARERAQDKKAEEKL